MHTAQYHLQPCVVVADSLHDTVGNCRMGGGGGGGRGETATNHNPLVLAVAAVGALPEPSVLPALHRIQEELADDVGGVGGFLSSVLLPHNTLQRLLVPVLHTLQVGGE